MRTLYIADSSVLDQGSLANNRSLASLIYFATDPVTLVCEYRGGTYTTYTVGTNTTIAADQKLIIEYGAIISVSNGVTLTINGPFSAGLYQVFDCQGTGEVVFGPGSTDRIYPQWFGVTGDKTTDDTDAFKKAFSSAKKGIPIYPGLGKFRLTDELPVTCGMKIYGQSSADNIYGSNPDPDILQTYFFQETENKSIFVLDGSAVGLEDIEIKNIVFSAFDDVTAYPSVEPVSDDRYGIRITGSYPNFAWNISIKNCLFYSLNKGISVVDPNAETNPAPHTYDWSIVPLHIEMCQFKYCVTGIYYDTNNADVTITEGCGFFIPEHGRGVHFRRTGYQKFSHCFGGGVSGYTTETRLFWIEGSASWVDGNDNLTFDNCQGETLTQFLLVYPESESAFRFNIHCTNCIAEMGADIQLSGNVHFISEFNRWTVTLYIADSGVKVSSIGDYFGANVFSYLTDADRSTAWFTFVPGPVTTEYADMLTIGGRTITWGTAAPVGGAWLAGDMVFNTNKIAGSVMGWVCLIGGAPGTWTSWGQADGSQAAGSPSGVIPPQKLGHMYYDTENTIWYISTGLTNTDWVAINS